MNTVDTSGLSHGTPAPKHLVDKSPDTEPEGWQSPSNTKELATQNSGKLDIAKEFNVKLMKIDLLQLHADLLMHRQHLGKLCGRKISILQFGGYNQMREARANVALAQQRYRDKELELAGWQETMKAAEARLVNDNKAMLDALTEFEVESLMFHGEIQDMLSALKAESLRIKEIIMKEHEAIMQKLKNEQADVQKTIEKAQEYSHRVSSMTQEILGTHWVDRKFVEEGRREIAETEEHHRSLEFELNTRFEEVEESEIKLKRRLRDVQEVEENQRIFDLEMCARFEAVVAAEARLAASEKASKNADSVLDDVEEVLHDSASLSHEG
ncbi:hypothetical protein EDC01DRAFT_746968 [Geopyxis carbonaria]|nr:hypothetical protein EDC01DRAFT_746968 [Geopyxis carbonaria]